MPCRLYVAHVVLLFAILGCGDPSPAHELDGGTADATTADAATDGAVQLKRLIVTFTGQGGGIVSSGTILNCGPTCVADVPVGSTITLTAAPDAHSTFTGWSGSCTGSAPDCTIVMDDDQHVVASFDLALYTVSLTRTGAGTGRLVNINPGPILDCGPTCTATCPYGTQLWIEPRADFGSRYAGWSGCPALFGGYACAFPVSGDVTASATFHLGHTWGTTGIDRGADVAFAPDGSLYMVGMFSGHQLQFGQVTVTDIFNNPPTGFIVKLGTNLEGIWAKDISETTHLVVSDGAGNAITAVNYDAENPNPYPTIGYSWMIQRYLSTNGTRDQSGGGNGVVVVRDIAVDANGNVAVVGTFSDWIAFDGIFTQYSAGIGDVFVGRIDGTTWTMSWLHRYGAAGNDDARGVAFDANGNIWVTGFFHDSVSFGGATFTAAPQTTSGFVAHYDGATGAHLWSRSLATTALTVPETVSISPGGNVRVGGHLKGTGNFGGNDLSSPNERSVFAVELDPTGAHVSSWTTPAGDPAYSADRFAFDAAGNLVLTRSFSNTVQLPVGQFVSGGSTDVLVAKFAAGTGTMLWARSAGGGYPDEARGLTLDSLGRPYVVGSFQGSGPFGTSTSGDDILLFPVAAPP